MEIGKCHNAIMSEDFLLHIYLNINKVSFWVCHDDSRELHCLTEFCL